MAKHGALLNKFGKLAKGTPTPMRVFLKDSVSAKGLSVEAISSLKRQAKTAVLSCNRQAAAEKQQQSLVEIPRKQPG